jgi:adenosylmethionine-8-amino-7-oxononanoate aminotransferase
VFFTDNGSTSIEVALKMAIQFFSNKNAARKSIIAFENAYHGDTFGAMSVGARSTFSAPFDDYLFDVIRIPIPNDNNFESTKLYFQELIATKNIAAFIFEPLLLGVWGNVDVRSKIFRSTPSNCKK